MTKSDRIRELLKANPKIKTSEIAKQVKCNSALIYQIKSQLQKPKTEISQGQNILREVISADSLVIKQLKNQIMGYKFVISYLEHQLGLKDSQNGTSV